jgi:hypothetical protein
VDGLRAWIHDRALTIVLMAMFFLFLIGQVIAGLWEYNDERAAHGRDPIALTQYFSTGHLWEAVFENWESEFLQMAVFILLTTCLVQKGSPESRRPHKREAVDADPRKFADDPNAPWPVRRGGWVLRIYENSLGLAFVLMFLVSWAGHAWGGFIEFGEDQAEHGQQVMRFADYLLSPRFWFESFQNWQSEFLSIAAMVWLAVYLRQRYSPESKPVHAAHND